MSVDGFAHVSEAWGDIIPARCCTVGTLPPTPLERAESLEQLRALEHGYAIAVRIAPEPFPAGVDTPEDLARVRQLLER